MKDITINGRKIGPSEPVYIVAEMSANHNRDFDSAVKLLEAAKHAGADAIKLQTYTPDTLTIDCSNEAFKIKSTIWQGKNLFDLYREAYTPWDWQPKLKQIADNLNIDLFSTPFDDSAVDFLENMGVPAYKISSFEIIDVNLIQRIATLGKPMIISTGMATLGEIEEAVNIIRDAGNNELALLKCTSAYPAEPKEMNLRTISHLAASFGVPTGLSDHTLGDEITIASIACGACIIEKHFTLSREIKGPDSAFSMEPAEFRKMVDAIRNVEAALGTVSYHCTEMEKESRKLRRSLFVVNNIKAGELFTGDNVRSIRPANGLHPRYLSAVLGRRAKNSIERGTPLSWNLIN